MQVSITAAAAIDPSPKIAWNGGTTPLPDVRTAAIDQVGNLLVRHPKIGDWAPARDTVLAVLPANRPSIEGPSFDSISTALTAAKLASTGAEHPAVGIQHSYANEPTRRVFRLVELAAPTDFGVVQPLHIEQGTTTVNAEAGKVVDASFDGLAAIVDGAFQLVAADTSL